MSRWFRHYGGLMRDEKLVSVAVRSKQPVERVVWVWGAILESAAEIDDGGRYELDAAEVAYFLRADEADICAILVALENAGRVASCVVVKWSDRQYESDASAKRQSAYRERKRQRGGDSDVLPNESDVTPPSRDGPVTAVLRHVTVQDTDTDTDTEVEVEKGNLTVSQKKRGHRLPDDFEPDGTAWAIADEHALTSAECQLQRDSFMDYFQAVPGSRGLKLDWQGTFRNWLRKYANDKPKAKSNGNASQNVRSGSGVIAQYLADAERRGLAESSTDSG